MKLVQDLSIQSKCQQCHLRNSNSFCNLPQPDLSAFTSIKITKVYPKGTLLFVEGQASNGIYMLCQGRVKLSTCSPDGKVIIIGIAGPGDIVGLSATLEQTEYEISAEVIELCQVNFVPGHEMIRFLAENPSACLQAARQLSRNYKTAYRQICALGMSDSVNGRLAKLFLAWSADGTPGEESVAIKNFYTHEEIAEMIGSSRETVTRALKFFREQDLISLKGSNLVIHDRRRLRSVIKSRRTINSEM